MGSGSSRDVADVEEAADRGRMTARLHTSGVAELRASASVHNGVGRSERGHGLRRRSGLWRRCHGRRTLGVRLAGLPRQAPGGGEFLHTQRFGPASGNVTDDTDRWRTEGLGIHAMQVQQDRWKSLRTYELNASVLVQGVLFLKTTWKQKRKSNWKDKFKRFLQQISRNLVESEVSAWG